MPFFQEPPVLANPYRTDRALQEYLDRALPSGLLSEFEPQLDELGARAAGPLLELAQQAEREQPVHVPFDAWGRRVDHIRVSAAWEALHLEQVRLGICAVPYEDACGEYGRLIQHALIHLYGPSSATYTCPIAMTDAAVRVLRDSAPPDVQERVAARLSSRDPDRAWTSGQWMTEREGGSDVGQTATIARQDADGAWRLSGTKWFTSATTADCALTLARPEGAGEGSAALALFLVEVIDPRDGRDQVGDTIRINRLKDKLGTKSLPTAELTLDGAYATLIGEPSGGLKRISAMLNVTRAHNAMGAAGGMRRAVDLATAYAGVRTAFGERLIDLPLHRETLAEMAIDAEAAFALTFRVLQLMGRAEAGTATGTERIALRGLLPVAKLLTGKDAVAVASEALESFGGAGYIEDTTLPQLLRNAQVLPIWEGTTNVLSLDLLRAAMKEDALAAVMSDLSDRLPDEPALASVAEQIAQEQRALTSWAQQWPVTDPALVQAGMRTFALRLGRCYTAGLLCDHAAFRLAKHSDDRAALVARRYVARWLSRQAPEYPGEGRGEESLRLLCIPNAVDAPDPGR